jgi:hypothetical protein
MLVRLTPLALALALAVAPRPARAEEAPAPLAPATPPTTAFAALVRAEAAYEYGDMLQVVEATRPVAEGTLASSNVQRARALRFLGVGLFLTNRSLGAENAFAELLRIDPTARLDPTTTRPEVVAFFENIRHQSVAREKQREWSSRSFVWNLLPPAGQFQNGHKTKGWILAGAELVSLAGFVTSRLVLYSWYHPANGLYSHSGDVPTVRLVQYASIGVLGAAYLYGVIDGLVHYYRATDEATSSLTWFVSPAGGALRLTF